MGRTVRGNIDWTKLKKIKDTKQGQRIPMEMSP